ncbi:DNA-directed DNA polymerase II small subunit [Candidatus Micrarchaeota archaeon]|nr:DNA-directed DNA polymerase II small subunit [Candidatus Micrarchaeota archaeon]
MQAQEALTTLQGKGFLVTPGAAKLILESQNPAELVTIIEANCNQKWFVEPRDLLPKEEAKLAQVVERADVVVEHTDFKPLAKEYDSQVRVLMNVDHEESASTGTLEDFVDYFKNRYEDISLLLRGRGENSIVPINELARRRGQSVAVIGMVNDKRQTKNGHLLVEVEDPTGKLTALVMKTNEALIKSASWLVNDEVVLLDGKLSKDLFIINKITEPDVPLREMKTTEDRVCFAFLSDIHVGSKLFMRKNFEYLIEWLHGKHGNERERELAGRIKYISLAGDLCDGIGVYPSQENELEITDIYKQYEALENYIIQFPDYIHVVVAPGDHDAVKHADPQPKLPKELVPNLYGRDNVSIVSSPAMVELHGLKELVYHGTSYIDFMSTIPGVSAEHGGLIMKEMLKKRHIHPIYGGKPITPEKKDSLVMREVPDIFHTGESHCFASDFYRGTYLVNGGTWQDLTDYIVMQGFKATPCILPVFDAHRGKATAIHFDGVVQSSKLLTAGGG